jgi:hypothetical protein
MHEKKLLGSFLPSVPYKLEKIPYMTLSLNYVPYLTPDKIFFLF